MQNARIDKSLVCLAGPPYADASMRRLTWVSILTAVLVAAPLEGLADGVLRDGAGARAMSLGGASVGSPDLPLEALFSNPAGLGFADASLLQIGGVGGFARGNFPYNAANNNSPLHQGVGAIPEAAFVQPLESLPLAFGLAVIPESLASVDWRFTDAPGGLDGSHHLRHPAGLC